MVSEGPDDAQMTGLGPGSQRPEMLGATVHLDPIFELARQALDVSPIDAEQPRGIRVQRQGRVLDGLDLADIGAAVIGRANVALVVAGHYGSRGEKQHEADYGQTSEAEIMTPAGSEGLCPTASSGHRPDDS
jgi:hypothetical protein